MFSAFMERRCAKRLIKGLLASYSVVIAEKPELSGEALYKEVLVQNLQVDPRRVDQILKRAEASIDEWTKLGSGELGFREIVHYITLNEYLKAGHTGAAVSFRKIVSSLVPADL